MASEFKQILEQVIKETLEKMDFGGWVTVNDSQPDSLIVNIESDEANLLIGQGGATMIALQHLVRAIINKKLGSESPKFAIDINDYRAHRLNLLKEMALAWAKEVVEQKQPKVLEPMSSYERRIVHIALKDFEGVNTESQGDEPARRIVINPA